MASAVALRSACTATPRSVSNCSAIELAVKVFMIAILLSSGTCCSPYKIFIAGYPESADATRGVWPSNGYLSCWRAVLLSSRASDGPRPLQPSPKAAAHLHPSERDRVIPALVDHGWIDPQFQLFAQIERVGLDHAQPVQQAGNGVTGSYAALQQLARQWCTFGFAKYPGDRRGQYLGADRFGHGVVLDHDVGGLQRDHETGDTTLCASASRVTKTVEQQHDQRLRLINGDRFVQRAFQHGDRFGEVILRRQTSEQTRIFALVVRQTEVVEHVGQIVSERPYSDQAWFGYGDQAAPIKRTCGPRWPDACRCGESGGLFHWLSP